MTEDSISCVTSCFFLICVQFPLLHSVAKETVLTLSFSCDCPHWSQHHSRALLDEQWQKHTSHSGYRQRTIGSLTSISKLEQKQEVWVALVLQRVSSILYTHDSGFLWPETFMHFTSASIFCVFTTNVGDCGSLQISAGDFVKRKEKGKQVSFRWTRKKNPQILIRCEEDKGLIFHIEQYEHWV